MSYCIVPTTPAGRRAIAAATDLIEVFQDRADAADQANGEPFRLTGRLSEAERATLMGGACAKAYGWAPESLLRPPP